MMKPDNERPPDQASGRAKPAVGEETESTLPAGWTHADLQVLADRVYQLLLKDLLLERERGAW